jgi:hypothetical protein
MRLAVLMIVVAGTSPNFSAWGQDISKEYKIKSVYLYKFATYVTWSEKPQQQELSPFVIGILGPGPAGKQLAKQAKHHWVVVDKKNFAMLLPQIFHGSSPLLRENHPLLQRINTAFSVHFQHVEEELAGSPLNVE